MSDAQPRRRALLIGINYVGQPAELAGCVNDIADMLRDITPLGYGEVRVLHDGSLSVAEGVTTSSPTRANIVEAMKWLVAGVRSGDRLFLHYSGHGGQLRGASESDGMDETIIPVDYATAGVLRDDELRALLVDPLYESRATLRAVLDCCHSGTGLDLRYNLSACVAGARATPRAAATAEASQLNDLVAALVAEKVRDELVAWFGEKAVAAKLPREPPASFLEWTEDDTQVVLSAQAVEQRRTGTRTRSLAPDVLLVSGCTDGQTSADAAFGGRPNGALTFFLRACLARTPATAAREWPRATDLLRDLRAHLVAAGFSQFPQLSSEVPVDGATRFDLL